MSCLKHYKDEKLIKVIKVVNVCTFKHTDVGGARIMLNETPAASLNVESCSSIPSGEIKGWSSRFEQSGKVQRLLNFSQRKPLPAGCVALGRQLRN
jgi:hypothetical protein